MKSNSIAGLAFSLFPLDTTIQKTQNDWDKAITDGSGDSIILSGNNFYLFEGDMPEAAVLSAYSDTNTFLAAYASKQILKITDFGIRWTYDKEIRRRKLERWPVDAVSYNSAVTGTAKWAAIELTPASVSISDKLFIFTDAVGSWDDADQSILVSSTTVVTGESITVKSINITLQDALVIDLIP